jgi:hypothetical protein
MIDLAAFLQSRIMPDAAEAKQHARRRGPLDRRAAIDLDKILSIRPNEKSGRAAAVRHLLLRRKQRIVARALFNSPLMP